MNKLIHVTDPLTGAIFSGEKFNAKNKRIVCFCFNKNVVPEVLAEFLILVLKHYPPSEHSYVLILDGKDGSESRLDLVWKHNLGKAADYHVIRCDHSPTPFSVKHGVYVLHEFIDYAQDNIALYLDTDMWCQSNMFDIMDNYWHMVSCFAICAEQCYPKYSPSLWDNLYDKETSVYSEALRTIDSNLELPTKFQNIDNGYFPLVNTGVMMFQVSVMKNLGDILQILQPLINALDLKRNPYLEQLAVNVGLAAMSHWVTLIDPKFNYQLQNPHNEVFLGEGSETMVDIRGKKVHNVHFNGKLGRRRYTTINRCFRFIK